MQGGLFRSLLLAGENASMSGTDDDDLADQFLVGFEDGDTCLLFAIYLFISPNIHDMFLCLTPGEIRYDDMTTVCDPAL